MKKNRKLDKEFYKLLIVVAIPIIIQNLISIGLNMVDSIMIGKLGVNPLAAVGLANRIYFIFSMICFGIFSGSSIFIAQYWGVKDIKNIKKVFGINIFLGTALSLVSTIVVLIFSKQILSIFSSDNSVVEQGVDYLRIICFSYIFTALSFAASFNSRAIHKLRIPTLISAIAIMINTFLNYLLIYGKFGFPEFGVKGAAIATFIARIIEFIFMFLYIYKSKNHPLAATFKEMLSWDITMLKNVIKTSFPVIVSESSWALGTTVYYIAYGIIGPSAIAVVQVAYIINDLFQSMFLGVGNAASVILGNEIGKNNLEKAENYSKKLIKITFILNIVVSIALILVRNIIVDIYNFDSNTSIMLEKSLIVFALFTTPKMFTYVFICGILRSGGDTKYCMTVELITIWLIGVPLAFFGVLVLKLPLHWVLTLVFSEEIIKLFIIVKRYKTKNWLNNLI
ncbi:MATE family efflux transporter [Sedimentibacter sp. zth1]|uniref:MATE family efflux transporter n=1 Tax=Sedimentibacter sp. zth1 TaxID=2816908 RepID=UPI001A916506|nr:MATE family efflux transporter [Sedimentibacter sp. zth1]QSX05200.1 MATE family efflux transporter [Sedimentibacter sp. zth1]